MDLDTTGIDAALGAKGANDGGIYNFGFARREIVVDHDHGDRHRGAGRVPPPGMGMTTAIGFQPVGPDGDARAAVNGDVVMTAGEVNEVIVALRRHGIDVVALHNHGLREEPRPFYLHFWAVGDGVELAESLRGAVEATDFRPAG